MLIKKKFGIYRLYTHILISFVLAAIVSLLVWNIAFNLSDIIQSNQSKQIRDENKLYFNELANSLKESIKENHLSAKQVAKIYRNNHDEKEYDIYIVDSRGKMYSKNGGNEIEGLEQQGIYIYQIDFSDGAGFVLIKSEPTKLFGRLYRGIGVIIALTTFITITIFLVGKQLKYIGEINSGIDILADGSLSYCIPEKGNNELTHLAVSINEMSVSLRKLIREERLADAKQRRLITNLSHDLRTPLTSIVGYLNLLSDEKYDSKEDARDFLAAAQNKCSRLEKLINNLFAYTKLTNGEMSGDFIAMDIKVFTLQYLEMHYLDIKLESYESRSKILADVDWLQRIFDNLVDNIKKYSVPNTPVKVLISNDANYVTVAFKNQSKENLDNKARYIFDRMYVANEERQDNSSGLGLSIVSEYMKQMNGSAYADYQEPILSIVLKFPLYRDNNDLDTLI